MKKSILYLALFLLATISIVYKGYSQDQYPKPDTANHPYYYDAGAAALTALEKMTATRKTQLKLLGLGGGSSSYIIPGAQSSVTLVAADSMSFVIDGNKLGIPGLNNNGAFVLYKLKQEGEERHAVIKEKKGVGGGDENKSEKIEYTTKKDGSKTVLVLMQKPAAGQYAFLNMRSLVLDKTIEVFCFKLD